VFRIVAASTFLVLTAGCGVLFDARAERAEARAEAAFPPEGQILEVEGRALHAVVRGSGPDLVLIHGASGNARDFTFAFVERMARTHRVIAFDRPGFGWSEKLPEQDGSIFAQARVLRAAAEQLGADKPVVLGHSYGGAVALAWAVTQPDAVGGLVLVGAAAMPWPGGISTFYKATGSKLGGATIVPVITAFATDSIVDSALRGIFAPQTAPEGYGAHVGAGLSLRRTSLRVNATERTTLRAEISAMAPRYHTISIPVEIIHGGADKTVPAEIHAAPLVEVIPDARLTVLDGVGHMPHHAAPDVIAKAIVRVTPQAGLR
jgi:pimeloyl-ACP methyl ester carboxylesterase